MEDNKLNFGIVEVGQSADLDVKIVNESSNTLMIQEVYNEKPEFYVDEDFPMSTPPSCYKEAKIIFKPIEHGYFTDRINFRNVSDSMLIAQQVFVKGKTNPLIVEEGYDVLYDYSLFQNYPNPFNFSTTISYALPSQNHVAINIFNSLGEDVAQLVNEIQETGTYNVNWQSGDLASGIYFYSIDAVQTSGLRHFLVVKKMILLK